MGLPLGGLYNVYNALAAIAATTALGIDHDAALRALQSSDEAKRREGADGIEDVLRRGNAGQVRVPGKHGAAPRAYEVVAVLINDQPGQLARIFADAGMAGVNIEDVRIEHATGQQAGLVQLMVEQKAAVTLSAALRERGWAIRQ